MDPWIKIIKEGNKVFLSASRLTVGQKVMIYNGFIELRSSPEQGLHIIRTNTVNKANYIIYLREDGVYLSCPDYGYRVVPAAERVSPIERILQRRKIPKTFLTKVQEPCITVHVSWYDNDTKLFAGIPTNQWHHDGTEEIIHQEIWERPHGQFLGGGHNQIVIRDASYALNVVYDGFSQYNLAKIVVWPECDIQKFNAALTAAMQIEFNLQQQYCTKERKTP